MKRSGLIFFIFSFLICGLSNSQQRSGFKVPDILGYKTLTSDMHTHTVLSDGLVWPTVRIHEARQESLDIIAITDHIESTNLFRLKRIFGEFGDGKDGGFLPDLNLPYEIAKEAAAGSDVIVINGGEISRTMPPGHHNAIFLTDVNPVATPHPQWKEAFQQARKQGAFIFWNHPASFHDPVTTTLWWEEHTWLLENDMMHGIEVVSGRRYYPEAHQWAIDKNLTMIASTDVHGPNNLQDGEMRSMTLIFAKERSLEGIKEALFDRRTVAYYDNKLIGKSKFLEAIFFNSILVASVDRTDNGFHIIINNPTDITFELSKAEGNDSSLEFFRTKSLPAGKQTIIKIFSEKPSSVNKIELKLIVNNLLIAPEKGLPVTLSFIPK
jgi:3',5'-nucleoside bisphosphate phosphatase